MAGNDFTQAELFYSAGTVSVTNGSTAVTGAGTAWLANIQPGDDIYIGAAAPIAIAARASNTGLTLMRPWSGATATGQAYYVRRSPWHLDDRALGYRMATLLTIAGDIESALPLTGGTLTGGLAVSGNFGAWTTAGWGAAVRLPNGHAIQWPNVSGTVSWGVGVSSDAFFVARSTNSDASQLVTYPLTVTPTGLTVLGNTVWHAGNFNPTSLMPVFTLTNGVAGQFIWLAPGIDNPLVLPAGGTWAYFGLAINSQGAIGASTASIAAGGSTVGSAFVGFYWTAFAVRIV